MQCYKPSANSRPVDCGISKIFSEEIIALFNWDGSQKKEALKNLSHFNKALYGVPCILKTCIGVQQLFFSFFIEAWKGTYLKSYEEYTACIKVHLNAAKSRQHQNRFRQKKMHVDNVEFKLLIF